RGRREDERDERGEDRPGQEHSLSLWILPAVARAFIGLGSNLGDREAWLRRAVAAVGELPRTEVVGVSPLRDTAPVRGIDQRRFVLEPLADLDHELEIPAKGRVQALLAELR